jgi:hypothetical protein
MDPKNNKKQPAGLSPEQAAGFAQRVRGTKLEPPPAETAPLADARMQHVLDLLEGRARTPKQIEIEQREARHRWADHCAEHGLRSVPLHAITAELLATVITASRSDAPRFEFVDGLTTVGHQAAAMRNLDLIPDSVQSQQFYDTQFKGVSLGSTAARSFALEQIPAKFQRAEWYSQMAERHDQPSPWKTAAVSWHYAHLGQLDKIPPALLPEILASDTGQSVPAIAAATGHLKQIPEGALTAENMGHEVYVLGSATSALDAAAQHRHLDQVPSRLLTPEALRKSDSLQRSVLQIAAAHGSLDQLRPELLTREAVTRNDANGYSALHAASRRGHLKQIPPTLLTVETMSEWARCGRNSFTCAAENGHLEQVPPVLLTVKTVTQRDCTGRSVLALAAAGKELSEIPPEVMKAIPAEEFTRPTDCANRYSVLHLAAEKGGLGFIPLEKLTAEALATCAKDGNTVIDCLDDNGKKALARRLSHAREAAPVSEDQKKSRSLLGWARSLGATFSGR